MQIATRRPQKQLLRFVSNQTYHVRPGGSVGAVENCYLQFRANSIYDICDGNNGNGSLNQPSTWIPQDSTIYGPSLTEINAEGFEDWRARFSHFTVIGSKISVSYEPYGIQGEQNAVQVPTTVYVNLAGNQSQIGPGTQMSAINKLPYTKRASIVPSQTNSTTSGLLSTSTFGNAGVRLYSFYSAKKFEGISDVMDNEQLKGAMLASPAAPQEQAFFTVGLRNTIPSVAAGDRMPQGIMRIRLEYITMLTEPSSTNQVSALPQ